MWLLRNSTPYACERNWTRDASGVHWWLVAVRGTFEVGPRGKLSLADEQLPPVLAPEYVGEPGQSSLRYDSDLLEHKPGTDVVVLGRAHAPKGRPATSVPVVLRVAAIEKQLVVFGDRVYFDGVAGMTTTSPRPFVTQPIEYEYAYGGADLSNPDPTKYELDERNPVGRGFPPSKRANQPAHTIEYASGSVTAKGPAGFGPIDRSWLPRRTLAGTYDARWAKTKKPLLPDDYDPRFAMCSPVDQRPASPLLGGEAIGVLNMSPEGTLTFETPRVTLRMVTKIAGARHEHAAKMVSVIVEPDERKVSVVWQSALRVPAPKVDELDATEISEIGGGR